MSITKREVALSGELRARLERHRSNSVSRWLRSVLGSSDPVERELAAGIAEEYTVSVQHFAAGECAGSPVRLLECEASRILLLFGQWQTAPPVPDAVGTSDWFQEFVITRTPKTEIALDVRPLASSMIKAERIVDEGKLFPLLELGKNSSCEVAFFDGTVATLDEDLATMAKKALAGRG